MIGFNKIYLSKRELNAKKQNLTLYRHRQRFTQRSEKISPFQIHLLQT